MRASTSVLVVEDDAAIRAILTEILEGRKFDVVAVADGATALKNLGDVSLVLLDLVLPDVDGLDLIRAIRAISGVPIVVCSGRHTAAVEALRLGADDFIRKPFDLDDLEARVDAVLRRARVAPVSKPPRLEVTDQRIRWDGKQVDMAHQQHVLMIAMAATPGVTVPRATLEGVLQDTYPAGSRQLDMLICRLRGRLRQVHNGPRIFTSYGLGYGVAV